MLIKLQSVTDIFYIHSGYLYMHNHVCVNVCDMVSHARVNNNGESCINNCDVFYIRITHLIAANEMQ